MDMQTVLFINFHSRRARKNAKQVESFFADSNFKITKVIRVKKLRMMPYYLKQLKAQKMDCVLVGSGDGTLDAVLNTLKNRKVTYGFIPLGTGNGFVQSLGLPADIEGNLNIIAKGKTRLVSLGQINNRLFANYSAVGISVKISKYISNDFKKVFGQSSYVLYGLWQLLRHKAMLCTVTTGKQEKSFYTHHLMITNGRYHGPIEVSKKISAYNDKLMLVAFGTSQSRLRYAWTMVKFAMGKHKKDIATEVMTLENANVSTDPKRRIESDGEVIGKTPAKVKVLKKHIEVFVN